MSRMTPTRFTLEILATHMHWHMVQEYIMFSSESFELVWC